MFFPPPVRGHAAANGPRSSGASRSELGVVSVVQPIDRIEAIAGCLQMYLPLEALTPPYYLQSMQSSHSK